MGAIVDEAIAYRTVPEVDDPTGAVERFNSGEIESLRLLVLAPLRVYGIRPSNA